MPRLMLNHITLRCKAATAVITFERFVTRMNPLMQQQIRQMPKLLAAYLLLIFIILQSIFTLRLTFDLAIGIHDTHKF
mgnify:CR=1 FL=1